MTERKDGCMVHEAFDIGCAPCWVNFAAREGRKKDATIATLTAERDAARAEVAKANRGEIDAWREVARLEELLAAWADAKAAHTAARQDESAESGAERFRLCEVASVKALAIEAEARAIQERRKG